MKVLVTGASGFVGRGLVGHLAGRGHVVVAVSRRPIGHGPAVEAVNPSTLDEASLDATIAQHAPDVVIHLAAAGVNPGDRDPWSLFVANTLLPAAVVRIAKARSVRAVVVAGSSAEYAAPSTSEPLDERAPVEVGKLYGATKQAGTAAASALARSLELPFAVLRLFNVFGPGEAPHRLLPSITAAASRGDDVALSTGRQVRDFVALADACRAFEAAAMGLVDGSLDSGIYNVCSGSGTTVENFARLAARAAGLPESALRFGAIPMRPDDVPTLVGSPAAFVRATGWRATADLAASIASAVAESRQSADASHMEPAR